jgi:hypothetical protein
MLLNRRDILKIFIKLMKSKDLWETLTLISELCLFQF